LLVLGVPLYQWKTRCLSSGCKAATSWIWALAFIWGRDWECVELYPNFNIHN
jgi:hypothetical protein